MVYFDVYFLISYLAIHMLLSIMQYILALPIEIIIVFMLTTSNELY